MMALILMNDVIFIGGNYAVSQKIHWRMLH